MTHFLQYWKTTPTSIEIEQGTPLVHCGSEQYRGGKLNRGDILWIMTATSKKDFYLAGRIQVGEVISEEEARTRFDDNVFERNYHVVAEPGTEEPYKGVNVSDVMPLLRFVSKTRPRLTIVNGEIDGRELQTIRTLTPSTVATFEDRWYGTELTNLAEVEIQISRGGGFGSPERNKKVEKAAIDFVIQKYEADGWEVESVEAKKCGYDLICRKDGSEKHVEVKGVSGTESAFIITANELKHAETNPLFYLCLVTAALTDAPLLGIYTGKEFLRMFKADAIAYRAITLSSTTTK